MAVTPFVRTCEGCQGAAPSVGALLVVVMGERVLHCVEHVRVRSQPCNIWLIECETDEILLGVIAVTVTSCRDHVDGLVEQNESKRHVG